MGAVLRGAAPGADSRQSRCPAAIITGAYTRKYSLEGLNSVVRSVRSAARGFRSIAYFRTVIFLRLGRLDFSAQRQLACATHQKRWRALNKRNYLQYIDRKPKMAIALAAITSTATTMPGFTKGTLSGATSISSDFPSTIL